MDYITDKIKFESKFLSTLEEYTNMSGMATTAGANPGANPGTSPVVPGANPSANATAQAIDPKLKKAQDDAQKAAVAAAQVELNQIQQRSKQLQDFLKAGSKLPQPGKSLSPGAALL
jgi:hypothetical protein